MAQHDRYDNDILRALQDISKHLAVLNNTIKHTYGICTPEELKAFMEINNKATEGDSEDGGV